MRNAEYCTAKAATLAPIATTDTQIAHSGDQVKHEEQDGGEKVDGELGEYVLHHRAPVGCFPLLRWANRRSNPLVTLSVFGLAVMDIAAPVVGSAMGPENRGDSTIVRPPDA